MDWENVLVTTGVRYIAVLFHIFSYINDAYIVRLISSDFVTKKLLCRGSAVYIQLHTALQRPQTYCQRKQRQKKNNKNR